MFLSTEGLSTNFTNHWLFDVMIQLHVQFQDMSIVPDTFTLGTIVDFVFLAAFHDVIVQFDNVFKDQFTFRAFDLLGVFVHSLDMICQSFGSCQTCNQKWKIIQLFFKRQVPSALAFFFRKNDKTYVDLMVMHLSCSSFLVSVALVSPALAEAIIPALDNKESVKVDLPWSTWAITDMFRMLCFLSMMVRISSTVKFT